MIDSTILGNNDFNKVILFLELHKQINKDLILLFERVGFGNVIF